jgi:hypothetical protein
VELISSKSRTINSRKTTGGGVGIAGIKELSDENDVLLLVIDDDGLLIKENIIVQS